LIIFESNCGQQFLEAAYVWTHTVTQQMFIP